MKLIKPKVSQMCISILVGVICMIFSDVVCIGEQRDDNKLLCSDGELTDSWDWEGCSLRGTVRIQCPEDYYPCNNLRSKEFVCDKTCDNDGGKRECHLHNLGVRSGLQVDVSKLKIGHKAGDDLEGAPPRPLLDIFSCSCRFN